MQFKSFDFTIQIKIPFPIPLKPNCFLNERSTLIIKLLKKNSTEKVQISIVYFSIVYVRNYIESINNDLQSKDYYLTASLCLPLTNYCQHKNIQPPCKSKSEFEVHIKTSKARFSILHQNHGNMFESSGLKSV